MLIVENEEDSEDARFVRSEIAMLCEEVCLDVWLVQSPGSDSCGRAFGFP
jgi:hypothetical protein